MLDAWVAKSIGGARSLDRVELEAWRRRQLKTIVDYARQKSLYYRERLGTADIACLSDFCALPFTTADDLREQGTRMLCVPAREVERIVTLNTSGTTGCAKRVFFSAEDLERTVGYFQHGMAEFTSAGQRVMSLFPGCSPNGMNDLLSRALARLGASFEHLDATTEERCGELLAAILSRGIIFLAGPASVVAKAARLSEADGSAARIAGLLQGVLLSGAYVPEKDRQDIARIWSCNVNEHYGMTETGFAGAVGCSCAGGYHIWESGLYYEVVDPVNGIPMPEGTAGELVVTTLTRHAMPLIRYRTGDISRIIPGLCPCGSHLKRLERVGDRPESKGSSAEI